MTETVKKMTRQNHPVLQTKPIALPQVMPKILWKGKKRPGFQPHIRCFTQFLFAAEQALQKYSVLRLLIKMRKKRLKSWHD